MTVPSVELASVHDATSLAELIYESGQDNLCAVFESPGSPHVLHYLRFALGFADGQFGYGHHQVIREGNQVVACGSMWTQDVTDSFRQATLKSLLDFYGVQVTQEILTRSEALSHLIPAPEPDALGLGHIAVALSHRRRGLGHRLLNHYLEQAKSLGKAILSLDVSEDNPGALKAYQAFGFEVVKTRSVDSNPRCREFKPHLHMQLKL